MHANPVRSIAAIPPYFLTFFVAARSSPTPLSALLEYKSKKGDKFQKRMLVLHDVVLLRKAHANNKLDGHRSDYVDVKEEGDIGKVSKITCL